MFMTSTSSLITENQFSAHGSLRNLYTHCPDWKISSSKIHIIRGHEHKFKHALTLFSSFKGPKIYKIPHILAAGGRFSESSAWNVVRIVPNPLLWRVLNGRLDRFHWDLGVLYERKSKTFTDVKKTLAAKGWILNCRFCRDEENILQWQWEAAEIRLFALLHALLDFI